MKRVAELLVVVTVILVLTHSARAKEPSKTEFQTLIVECGDAIAPELVGHAITRNGGIPTDRIAWARVVEDLTTFLQKLGYLDAIVTVETGSAGADTRPIVQIAEGRRYVVSRLEVVGNTTIPDRAFRRLMYLAEGEPFDRGLLQLTLDKFNELGILKTLDWSDVEITVDRDHGDVRVTINVVELPDYSGGQGAP